MTQQLFKPNMVKAFFAFMAERHAIYLRRQAQQPWPWTKDKILQQYKFTNVYRELDRTTQWFRERVREPMRHESGVVWATIMFRWFNRIETGQRLLEAGAFDSGAKWNGKAAIRWLKDVHPCFTGAYIIRSPFGMPKLEGVVSILDGIWKKIVPIENFFLQSGCTLEMATRYLEQLPYMGPFTSYEVATDLRHTHVLDEAPDIMTWANAGPGAMRGLDRLTGRFEQHKRHFTTAQYTRLMLDLLLISQDNLWPNNVSHPPLEMRDIEHSLCEFDKYMRVKTGLGKPRSIYRRPA